MRHGSWIHRLSQAEAGWRLGKVQARHNLPLSPGKNEAKSKRCAQDRHRLPVSRYLNPVAIESIHSDRLAIAFPSYSLPTTGLSVTEWKSLVYTSDI